MIVDMIHQKFIPCRLAKVQEEEEVTKESDKSSFNKYTVVNRNSGTAIS